MNSLATPPYDASDNFDSFSSSPALSQHFQPPQTTLRTVMASTWGVLDQPPPPTLREILAAYKSRGDGDRDMLLAMLNAKSAEDQRQASFASLHRTLLEIHQQDPSSLPAQSQILAQLSPPQAHLQHIASAAPSPPFPHLPPPPQQPQYASAHTAQSQSPQLFAHNSSPDLEQRTHSSHGHGHSHHPVDARGSRVESAGSGGGDRGGAITSPRITLPAIREHAQQQQRAILPATSRGAAAMNGTALPLSTSANSSSTTASKRKRARLSPGPGPSAYTNAPASASSRRAYGSITSANSTSTSGAGAGDVPPSPTPSSSRSHTSNASRRSLSPDREHEHELRRGSNGGAMAIGSLLSAHSSGGSNSSGGGGNGAPSHKRRLSRTRRDEQPERDLSDFDEIDADWETPKWNAQSRPSSGSDRDRERERYHHHHTQGQSHRSTPKSRSNAGSGGAASNRARPPQSRAAD